MNNLITKLRSMIGPAGKLKATPEEFVIRYYLLMLLEIVESQDARIKSLESAVMVPAIKKIAENYKEQLKDLGGK